MPDLDRSADTRSACAADIGPSPALLAAQRRLEQLRAERQRPRRRPIAIFRPPESHRQPTPAEPVEAELVEVSANAIVRVATIKPPPTTVRLHPALSLAILGAELASAGRIWLLLRVLDDTGQGWLATDQVREKLTRKESRTRVCGRRQLRNLLSQGQGIFWTRQLANDGGRERIWLRSPARVAAALNLERLSGRPVEIPLEALLGGIGQVRANFYATFHRARQNGDDYGAPISRTRLADLTHVPPRTQRLYDEAAGVKRQANYAVGAEYNSENIRERAWRHGRAVFQFVDHQGKQGPDGRIYVAWRLPNSYAIDSASYGGAASPDKRKRKDKRPTDLVTIGAQGNDRSLKRSSRQSKTLFHADGGAAGQAYNRDCYVDAYWPGPGYPAPVGSRPVTIWQVIGRSAPQRGGNLLPGL